MVKTEPTKIQSPPSTSPPSPNPYKKKFKGVRMRSWGSWVSEIRAPNQKTRIWLGSYSTPEAAARAYDAALLCLKGSSASLNFPVTTIDIPAHDTALSPKSIQRVAAAAAANEPVSPPRQHPGPPSPAPMSPRVDEGCTDPWYFDYGYPSEENENWFDFDPMMRSVFYSPPIVDQVYEEGDIRLWSFC